MVFVDYFIREVRFKIVDDFISNLYIIWTVIGNKRTRNPARLPVIL